MRSVRLRQLGLSFRALSAVACVAVTLLWPLTALGDGPKTNPEPAPSLLHDTVFLDEQTPIVVLELTHSLSRRGASLQSPEVNEHEPEAVSGAAACCPRFSLEQDWNCLSSDLWRDVESVCNRENLVCLLAAGGVSLAARLTIDDDVADNTTRHPNRWGKTQDYFGAIGNPGHQFAAAFGLYAWSLHTQDEEMHDLSKTLIDAIAITGVANFSLQLAANDHSPNGEWGAWPSGHVSSSVAVAAVLDEYYGHKVGIPAYMLSGLVAWERIDDREHWMSDIIFGAALGYVVGKTVGAEHHARFCGLEVQPYCDPMNNATGVCLQRSF